MRRRKNLVGMFRRTSKKPSRASEAIIGQILQLLDENGSEEDVVKLLECAPKKEDVLLVHDNLLLQCVMLDLRAAVTVLITDWRPALNAKHGQGHLLHTAALLGLEEMTRLLLTLGCKREAKGTSASTFPDHIKHKLPTHLLAPELKWGFKHHATSGQETAAYFAVLGHHPAILRLLLTDDDVTVSPGQEYKHLLHASVRTDSLECFHYLLKFYPEEVLKVRENQSPLVLALNTNNAIEFVEKLLQTGADKQTLHRITMNKEIMNGIHHVLRQLDDNTNPILGRKFCPLIRHLLRHGISPTERTSLDNNALHCLFAAVNPDFNYIFARAIVPQHQTYSYFKVVDEEILQLTQLFLDKGCLVNQVNKQNETPVTTLLKRHRHCYRFVQLRDYLRGNNNLDEEDTLASLFGLKTTLSLLKLCIKYGASMNMTNNLLVTPLQAFVGTINHPNHCFNGTQMYAFERNFMQHFRNIVSCLLVNGAEPSIARCGIPPLATLYEACFAAHSSDKRYPVLPADYLDEMFKTMELLLNAGARYVPVHCRSMEDDAFVENGKVANNQRGCLSPLAYNVYRVRRLLPGCACVSGADVYPRGLVSHFRLARHVLQWNGRGELAQSPTEDLDYFIEQLIVFALENVKYNFVTIDSGITNFLNLLSSLSSTTGLSKCSKLLNLIDHYMNEFIPDDVQENRTRSIAYLRRFVNAVSTQPRKLKTLARREIYASMVCVGADVHGLPIPSALQNYVLNLEEVEEQLTEATKILEDHYDHRQSRSINSFHSQTSITGFTFDDDSETESAFENPFEAYNSADTLTKAEC